MQDTTASEQDYFNPKPFILPYLLILIFSAQWALDSNPRHVQQNAIDHWHEMWGDPITARHIRSSKVTTMVIPSISTADDERVAVRDVTYRFENKYGETQEYTFQLPYNKVPDKVELWQRKSTAEVFVASRADKDNNPFEPPGYSGTPARVNATLWGVLLLVVMSFAYWILSFIAYDIFSSDIERKAMSRPT